MRSRALLLPLLALQACSPVYVYKSWRGEEALHSKARPVAQVLADPSTPPEVAARLRLAEQVLAYSVDVMGMPKTKNYTSYVALERPCVTYVVTACPKLSLEPYQWWFPFIGKVPYKGFFDLDDARKEQARLKAKDLDTMVGCVGAYSTLGWLRDPLLSTMLDDSDGGIAETLLHERTHAFLYFKSDADFNESMATFVGQQAAADFLARRFGKDSLEAASWREELKRRAKEDAAWRKIYDELKALYASADSRDEKLAEREAIFAAAAREFGEEKVNNAVVQDHQRYHDQLGDFQEAYERLDRDWPKFLALLKSLDRKDPRDALRRWLASGPKP